MRIAVSLVLNACWVSCMAVELVLTSTDQHLITLLTWPDCKVTLEGAEKEEAGGFGKVQICAAAKRI